VARGGGASSALLPRVRQHLGQPAGDAAPPRATTTRRVVAGAPSARAPTPRTPQSLVASGISVLVEQVRGDRREGVGHTPLTGRHISQRNTVAATARLPRPWSSVDPPTDPTPAMTPHGGSPRNAPTAARCSGTCPPRICRARSAQAAAAVAARTARTVLASSKPANGAAAVCCSRCCRRASHSTRAFGVPEFDAAACGSFCGSTASADEERPCWLIMCSSWCETA